MSAKLKHIAKFLALSMIFYRTIHCVKTNMETLQNIPRSGEYPRKPLKCFGTDEIEFAKCCIAPPFFSREIADQCGTTGAFRYHVPEQNVTGFARIGLSCESWTCILDQYHLLVNKLIDDKRFNMHLSRWVKLNPEFKETISNAKEHCRRNYILRFPMDPCYYRHYHFCYRNYINVDCPVRVNSSICDEQKKFYDECRQFFI